MTEIEEQEIAFTDFVSKVANDMPLERIILKVNGEEVLLTDWSLAGPGIVVATGVTRISGREAIEMAGTYEAKLILDGKGPGKVSKHAEKIVGRFLPMPKTGK